MGYGPSTAPRPLQSPAARRAGRGTSALRVVTNLKSHNNLMAPVTELGALFLILSPFLLFRQFLIVRGLARSFSFARDTKALLHFFRLPARPYVRSDAADMRRERRGFRVGDAELGGRRRPMLFAFEIDQLNLFHQLLDGKRKWAQRLGLRRQLAEHASGAGLKFAGTLEGGDDGVC